MKHALAPLLLLSGALWGNTAVGLTLTVCADPNNLPFSNQQRQGFENKISELIAKDLHADIAYVWWAQRRGYLRNTMGELKCDLWPGIANGVERMALSQPYYRSTYVFVTRTEDQLQGLTLDDTRLKSLSIGVQMIGNDANNTPPAHAIAARGIVDNVHGYMLHGNYAAPNPEAAVVTAVSRGDVDVALVWGPVAGYFAKRSKVPLALRPVLPADDATAPMSFDISVGVQPHNTQLLQQINTVLGGEKPAIDAILRSYQVPRAD